MFIWNNSEPYYISNMVNYIETVINKLFGLVYNVSAKNRIVLHSCQRIKCTTLFWKDIRLGHCTPHF